MNAAEYRTSRRMYRRACHVRANYHDFDPPPVPVAPVGYGRPIIDPLIAAKAKRSHCFALRAAAMAGVTLDRYELRDVAEYFSVSIAEARLWGDEARRARALADVDARRRAQLAEWGWSPDEPLAAAYLALPTENGCYRTANDVYWIVGT